MVNTSMVLGFEPADERNCQVLMELYELFQQVVWLDYPLTPHVTLAYFKPGMLGEEQICRLQDMIDSVNERERIMADIYGSMLHYQTFSSMACYRAVM